MEWIPFPDRRLAVCGLAWFEEDKPVLRRLPARLKETFPSDVWDLAQQPAGGRLRFRTDSTQIGLRAKNPDATVMHHITSIGQNGFDIFVDNISMGSSWPDANGNIFREWVIGANKKMHETVINLPLYKPAEISALGIEKGARIMSPSPFAVKKPVVFYGTSVTQGGCADTPGTSYQGFLSRWLNIDFINLGFSGAGRGEPALAEAICEIDCSCIVLDHWGNIGLGLKENLPIFTGILRKAHPKVPIIITGPFYFPCDVTGDTMHEMIRRDAGNFVRQSRRRGDRNMYFFDEAKMISPAKMDGLSDGCHPTSLGFYYMAKAFKPFLKHLLFK